MRATAGKPDPVTLSVMADLNETRRRFMTHFASIGLGTTLAPGILWARLQDAGEKKITLAMVTDAMKLSGLEFTEAELKAMVDSANQNLTRYEEMRAIHIPNDVSPPAKNSARVASVRCARRNFGSVSTVKYGSDSSDLVISSSAAL